jgi:AcrR family transcriptional regulator
MEKDISTEEKIKEAARKVFQEKGYGLTRTRDIADEAGINLALLNYYFRSKEKLFDIIMEESMHEMFRLIITLANDEKTSLSEKLDLIVNRYIDSLLKNPNLPLFVLSEIQANPQKVMKKIGLTHTYLKDDKISSALPVSFKQIQQQIDAKGLKGITPFHIFINIVSMCIFPFVGKPLLMKIHGPMDEEEYIKIINERRTLIPQWIKMMLQMDN